MANQNRTALLTKTHRVLKQHYTPVAPPSDRPLLEHLLFALVLENAPFDVAEKIFIHLSKNFFDWNEVRVSTVTELAEVGRVLPDPLATASNVKRVLQGVFESTYSFDLEPTRKQNISAAMKHLERLGGTTPFSLNYVTQVALGGHAIPLDRGALDVLAVLGIISDGESQSGKVSGLERVIPKNKGVEFGSLLHQMAAEYVANPFSPAVRKILLSINSDAKDRFPKRSAKKEEPREMPQPTGKKAMVDGKGKHAERPDEKSAAKGTAAKGAGEKHSDKGSEKGAAKVAGKAGDKSMEKGAFKGAAEHAAKKPEKPHPAADKADSKKPASGKHDEKKHAAHKHSDQKHSDQKHGDAKHRAAAKSHPVAAKARSASKQLSKRKPR